VAEVEEAMRALLLADPAVSALVAARIYPAPLPQGPTLPALCYQRISATRTRSQEGPSGRARARFQVDAWASTYDAARAAAAAVRRACDGFRGVVSGVELQEVQLATDRDLYEPDVQLHRVSADYFVAHEED